MIEFLPVLIMLAGLLLTTVFVLFGWKIGLTVTAIACLTGWMGYHHKH